jgi:BASS family bile acid:Na+ symporter
MSSISIDTTVVIRCLTVMALGGLLLAVGLRLKWGEVAEAVKRSRLVMMLAANFIVVPLLAIATARAFELNRDLTIGMILLAGAPFAPVVPVFARMARADLALAAGLTALFPFLSALLTPLVCVMSLKAVPGAEGVHFDILGVLGVLVATISLPLMAGIGVHHWRPLLAKRILRPIEVLSEAIGAISLAFVTAVEFKTVFNTVVGTEGKPLLAMVLATELSFLAGYAVGGATLGARRVMALGAGNRNIALALLVAIHSFAGTPVVGAVVANGLLMILLGLVHVAWWRCCTRG